MATSLMLTSMVWAQAYGQTIPGITGLAGYVSSPADMDGNYHLTVSGNRAYVAGYLDDGLTVLSIANPSTPTVLGTIKDSRLDGPKGVQVAGDIAPSWLAIPMMVLLR